MLFKSVDGTATGALARPPETHRSRSAWGGGGAAAKTTGRGELGTHTEDKLIWDEIS